MKTTVQFINDTKGRAKAVQMPVSQWTRLMKKLTKYEQMLKIKSDLDIAFAEVKKMQQGKIRKQSLQDFLNEL